MNRPIHFPSQAARPTVTLAALTSLGLAGVLTASGSAVASPPTPAPPPATAPTVTAPATPSAPPTEPAPADDPAEAQPPARELPKVHPYGFVRLDTIFNDSTMSHPHFPFWVASEPSGTENNAELAIHPRLTRVGLKLDPLSLGAWNVDGKIEIDFQNGGKESRSLIRMRHAYGQLKRGAFELLAGQTWDLLSPLYPTAHNDGMMWNAGNTGDRRAQIRLTARPRVGAKGHLRFAVAAGDPNAVNNQDLDSNGQRDGLDAAVPITEGLVEFASPIWTERPFTLGASGHVAMDRVNANSGDAADPNPFTESADFVGYSVGGHLLVPVVERIWVQGEAFYGQNLSDVRGGIGQGINVVDAEEIRSVGGWGEVGVSVLDAWSIHAGGSVDDPDDGDLEDADRSLNWSAFLVNRFRPHKSVQFAVEYLYWVTEYKDAARGTASRVNVWAAFHF